MSSFLFEAGRNEFQKSTRDVCGSVAKFYFVAVFVKKAIPSQARCKGSLIKTFLMNRISEDSHNLKKFSSSLIWPKCNVVWRQQH